MRRPAFRRDFGRWEYHGIGPGAALLHCGSGALAAIFGWRNLHGIGPGAALLQRCGTPVGAAPSPRLGRRGHHGNRAGAALLQRCGTPVGAAPSPRFSGDGTFTASGRGRPSYTGAVPLWERRPRRDFRVMEASRQSGRGRPSYIVGAAPSPRFSGGGTRPHSFWQSLLRTPAPKPRELCLESVFRG